MFNCIKVMDIELSRPLVSIENLGGYEKLKGLVRLHGKPIGYIQLPVIGDQVSATALHKAILEQHSWQIIHQLLRNGMAAPPQPSGLCIADLFHVSPPRYSGTLPLVTVAVCTRNRTADLELCLQALNCLDYPALDILVVDNAPSSNATERLVQAYPNMRYVCEPRPGLDWARNRAIVEARGEIIAYTDDDVVVDPGWVKALATLFAENPEVMAVTGLVIPYELETEAQFLFEMYGGFGRGFERKWYQVKPDIKMPWRYLGTGQFGTGANMAYRRSLFAQIGYFDPALDVGTVTNGGGDLEMFFRVLKHGHTLVYEPSAIVRHRHRRDYEKLRSQIANNGIGLYSYFFSGATSYPDQLFTFLHVGIWWLWWWHLRRLLISLVRPLRFPRDLILAEIQGFFQSFGRYQQAHQTAIQIAESFGYPPQTTRPIKPVALEKTVKRQKKVAVRTVDLSQPLQALTDVTEYSDVRVFVTWNNQPLGSANIKNVYQPISKSRLIEVIVNQISLKLLEPNRSLNKNSRWAEAFSIMIQHYIPTDEGAALAERLSVNISVSVIVATYDRPDDLRNCLRCLVAQESPRQYEIIVVDNNPASGLTPPVVAEFPQVVLVSELCKGLAYARNAGFIASKGDILITTDDDVTMPPDWLEKLIAPFARADVMAVTGNVLPLELETISQGFFEKYGGLGRGFEPFEVNGEWFESFRYRAVPTWDLGATANAAFSASIFSHPQIGLIDEALGAGTPTGCSEDTYLFYKILKAGYTLVYEPSAYVWHKHRRDMSALRRQIYNYSKGHVAYHLTTLLRDRDLRSLVRLAIQLPRSYTKRIKARLRGRSEYPLSLLLLEIAGNLAGPWSLWQSRQRVKREGHSDPYIPSQRNAVQKQTVELRQSQKISNSQLPELIPEGISIYPNLDFQAYCTSITQHNAQFEGNEQA